MGRGIKVWEREGAGSDGRGRGGGPRTTTPGKRRERKRKRKGVRERAKEFGVEILRYVTTLTTSCQTGRWATRRQP